MSKKIIVICFILSFLLCGCKQNQKNIVLKSQETINKDLSDDISIYYCAYNNKNNISYVKYHSDENGDNEAFIDFKNNKIYYENVYYSIQENDYDKIIEYGDYTIYLYQIESGSEDWEELDISTST